MVFLLPGSRACSKPGLRRQELAVFHQPPSEDPGKQARQVFFTRGQRIDPSAHPRLLPCVTFLAAVFKKGFIFYISSCLLVHLPSPCGSHVPSHPKSPQHLLSILTQLVLLEVTVNSYSGSLNTFAFEF